MATDGSACGTTARRGWQDSTRRRSGRGLPSALVARLLLLGACCVLTWFGLAALSSTTASAAETEATGTGTHTSGGLLDSGLLGQATGTVDSLAESVTTGHQAPAERPAADTTEDASESARGKSHRDAALLGSLTTSTVDSTHRSLAPVRAVVDPAADLVTTGLDQRATTVSPVLQTAHRAGQHVFGDVATELGPLTHAVPLSGSMPVSLDTVTSHLDAVTGQGDALAAGAPSAFQAATTAAAPAAVTTDGVAPPVRTGTTAPADDQGDVPGQPIDGDQPVGGNHSAPVTSHTQTSSQLGSGSGSAGSYAYAELVKMLAASRPSVAVPTTDADIASHDHGRPSVSPD